MRLLPALAVVVVLALPAGLLFCETQSGFPAPSYVLHIPGLQVAEMSPDEKYVSALVMHWPKGAQPSAELQVWDFHEGTLLQTRSLSTPETSSEADQEMSWTLGITRLRYTSDGHLMVVSMSRGRLHVLRTADLEEIRIIAVPSRDISVIGGYTGALAAPATIHTFEVSPAAHQVAVRVSDDVILYDLDSGREIRRWKINHSALYERGLAWRGDGGALAASVAHSPPCPEGRWHDLRI